MEWMLAVILARLLCGTAVSHLEQFPCQEPCYSKTFEGKVVRNAVAGALSKAWPDARRSAAGQSFWGPSNCIALLCDDLLPAADECCSGKAFVQ